MNTADAGSSSSEDYHPYVLSGDDPRTMRSPIRFLLIHVDRAIINIAPERLDEFKELHPRLQIELSDSHKWICEALPSFDFIRLSRRVVEVAWGAAFGYVTFYTEFVQKIKPLSRQVHILHDNPIVIEAVKLLKWIDESWLNNDSEEWPAHIPRPTKNPSKGSMENVTDEMALCIMAFFLHHELAHIRLGNGGGIEIEKQADAIAASEGLSTRR